MGPFIRSGASLVMAALLPLLGLAGPGRAGGSPTTSVSPVKEPASSPPLTAAPSSAPLPGVSSTPSLGQALKPSSPEQLALANHLRQQGAIFYGAYWCTHCFRQKDLFGQEAGDRLPYVECAKDQAGADRCNAADVRAYPTWVLGNERREGVQTLEELATWSGFAGFGSSGSGSGSGSGSKAKTDGLTPSSTSSPRVAPAKSLSPRLGNP
ncbi:MAG: hypothetical protein NTY67_03130 [Cyanobacteria bacterium]|nr:hypothetical protein [Cyanobacteriota bacterium]